MVSPDVDLKGFDNRKPEAEISTLAGDLTAENKLSQPDQYQPRISKLMLDGGKLPHNFPPQYYIIIKFSR